MPGASFFSKWFKVVPFLLIVFGFSSCTQEYLILLRNLDNAEFINLDQVLKESGLGVQGAPMPLKPSVIYQATNQNPVAESSAPSVRIERQLDVQADQDFSVNLSDVTNFIVLKSVQGGIRYLKEKSDLTKALFVFHSGTNNGSIVFHTADTDGKLNKSIAYSVRVGPKQPVEESKQPEQKKKTATNDQANEAVPSPNLPQMILSSIQGLSPTEAARELGKMMDSQEISDNDKEFIRYKLIEIMIDQRNYGQADYQITQIGSEPMKTLYRARISKAKGNQKEAVRNYISLLGNSPDGTRKTGIIELEDLLLEMGSADKNLLESLSAETKKYKNDGDFYGSSMIRIARIYPYLQDVYKSKDILESIMDGNFSEEIRAEARKAYEELKKDFLEYR